MLCNAAFVAGTDAQQLETEAPTSETLGKHSRESTPSDAGSDVSDSTDEDPDPMNEDLLQSRESRATGFVGSNSSVQWLRTLKTCIESTGGDDRSRDLPHRLSNKHVLTGLGHPASRSQYSGRDRQHGDNLRVSGSTFYLDDDSPELDVMVDPNELPSPETTERLFDYYMKTIHASFPILPDGYEDQFRKWNASRQLNGKYQVPEEWQAMLNLVLAIGAQYSHLTRADDDAEGQQDVVFMTRACRILHLDKLATSLPAPSLMFIQVIAPVKPHSLFINSSQSLGLLSLYYLTVGQVSR
jgi:hypothetical protein